MSPSDRHLTEHTKQHQRIRSSIVSPGDVLLLLAYLVTSIKQTSEDNPDINHKHADCPIIKDSSDTWGTYLGSLLLSYRVSIFPLEAEAWRVQSSQWDDKN